MEEILYRIALYAVPILLSLTVHEAAHAYAAYRLGDPLAKNEGRMTLNPIRHIDPVGTILIPALLILTKSPVVIGWAKPVPVNPFNLRNPKRDMAITAAAGPASNIALALQSIIFFHIFVFFYQTFKLTSMTAFIEPIFGILYAMTAINLALAVFNMIPVPPLDGGKVLSGVLSDENAEKLRQIEPYGMLIIIALLYFDIIDFLFIPVKFVLMTAFQV